MRINYVAFDSFGVKSSCVFIETPEINICIDPGIAVETPSFPLPTKVKSDLVKLYKDKIKNACNKADVIVITHYHYDHHIPKSTLYTGKHLLIKDPVNNINKSQKERAKMFLDIVTEHVKSVRIADKKMFEFKSTKIKFSKPLWHGPEGTKLGKVLMVIVEERGQKILYSSDVDGPYIKEYAKTMINEKPNIIILDGFPSYLLGFLASHKNLRVVIRNTINILKSVEAKIILDHHLLRDYRFKNIYHEVYKTANELGRTVHTAAEEVGKEPMVLQGYKNFGPTRWKMLKIE